MTITWIVLTLAIVACGISLGWFICDLIHTVNEHLALLERCEGLIEDEEDDN